MQVKEKAIGEWLVGNECGEAVIKYLLMHSVYTKISQTAYAKPLEYLMSE